MCAAPNAGNGSRCGPEPCGGVSCRGVRRLTRTAWHQLDGDTACVHIRPNLANTRANRLSTLRRKGGGAHTETVDTRGRWSRHAGATPPRRPYRARALSRVWRHSLTIWSRVWRNFSNEVRPESAVAAAWSSLERDTPESGFDIVPARKVQSCVRGPDPIPSSEWRVKPVSGPDPFPVPNRSRAGRDHADCTGPTGLVERGIQRGSRVGTFPRDGNRILDARALAEGATARDSASWLRCSASTAWQVLRRRVPRTLRRNLRTR